VARMEDVRSRSLPLLASLLALVGSMGCDGNSDLLEPPRSESATAPLEARAATVARHVALVMGDADARARITAALHASSYREHKVRFQQMLQESNARQISQAIDRLGGQAAFANALAGLPDLEFYMPVDDQRASWAGGSDVLVAIQLQEGHPIHAFDSQGNAVSLSEASPPSRPVLALVPVETDFSRPLNLDHYETTRASEDAVIGVYRRKEVGAGSGATNDPPGFYMWYSGIDDLKEAWIRGDPEVEVHLAGPGASTSNWSPYDCAGENESGYRYFDQDDHDWWSGVDGDAPLVGDSVAVEAIISASGDTAVSFVFVEDDTGPCEIKDENDVIADQVAGVVLAFSGLLELFGGQYWNGALHFFTGTILFATSVGGGDDLIGVAVPSADWNAKNPSEATDRPYVLVNGSGRNGTAGIEWRRYGISVAITGTDSVDTEGYYQWTMSAIDTTGSVTRQWEWYHWTGSAWEWDDLGTSPSQSIYLDEDSEPFMLRAIGEDSQSAAVSEIWVDVMIIDEEDCHFGICPESGGVGGVVIH
jgi:hypothetical protein